MQSFTLSHAELRTVAPTAYSTTGTRLDLIVDILESDRGLRNELPRTEIVAGLNAANGLNTLIAQGVAALGLADGSAFTVEDVTALNAWFNASATRQAKFVQLHGDDDPRNDVETGYHLLQNDGAWAGMFRENLANTVADGLYHIGFTIEDGRLLNEDGDPNACLPEVTAWLDYFFGGVTLTATPLDDLVEVILTDRGLSRDDSADYIMEGARAATALNRLILDGLAATGALADQRISAADIRAVNAWIRGDAARFDRFVELHGDDENGEEWGFHTVQNNGAESRFLGENFVNTVMDGIYHIGFLIAGERFYNEDGDANADIGDVATWLNHLLLNKALIEGSDADSWWEGEDVAETYHMMGGRDALRAMGGNDSVDLGAGDDWVDAGLGADTVEGGAGDDGIEGDEGNDSLSAGEGNDWIETGDGNDTADGGAGNDWLGGAVGRDLLRGGAGNDNLDGQVDNDTLDGGEGNDSLDGGTGTDRLIGGLGNDWLAGEDGNDRLEGGEGDDDFSGGRGRDTILGGNGNDEMSGDASHDLLQGDAGNDSLWGDTGNDTAEGGVGDDKFAGGEGQDSFAGSAGDDRGWGQDGFDTLAGGEGNDSLGGDLGNDSLAGEAGADTLDGGDHADTLSGGADDDKLWGGWGDDRMQGGAGADRLYGHDGADSVHGGSGNDSVDAGTGNDTAEGGRGADTVKGESGDDLIVSRSDAGANDLLRGDSGSDVFRFDIAFNATRATAEDYLRADGTVDWAALAAGAPAARWLEGIGEDTVQDFSVAGGDTIQIRGLGVTLAGITLRDVNGDRTTDSVLRIADAEGAAMGSVVVLGVRLTAAQVSVDAGAAIGAYASLAEWPDVI